MAGFLIKNFRRAPRFPPFVHAGE